MSSVQDFDQDLENASKVRQLLFCASFFLIPLTAGYEIGINIQQNQDLAGGRDGFVLSPEEISWLASMGVLLAIPANIIGGVLANLWGRKPAAMIVCPLFILGLLSTFSCTPSLLPLLFLGRVINGLASGLQHAVCYSYFTEITTPNLRTAVHAFSGVWYACGILIPIIFAAFNISWQTVSLVGVTFPVVAFVGLLFVPESPAWLVTKGRLDSAKTALILLRGEVYPHQAELRYLQKSFSFVGDRTPSFREFLGRLTQPDVWKPVLIVNITFLLQIWCGLAALDRYILLIFQASGSSFGKYTSAILVNLMKISGRLISTYLLVHFRRRPIYILSAIVTGIGAAGLGFAIILNPSSSDLFSQTVDSTGNQSFNNFNHNGSSRSTVEAIAISLQPDGDESLGSILVNYVPIASACLFMIGFASGIGPIPWAYGNELFPADLRSQLCGLMTSVVSLQTFLQVKSYPGISSSIGVGFTFLLFSSVGILSVLWGTLFLPETKGKTTHEVSQMFYSPSQLRLKRSESEGYSVCPT